MHQSATAVARRNEMAFFHRHHVVRCTSSNKSSNGSIRVTPNGGDLNTPLTQQHPTSPTTPSANGIISTSAKSFTIGTFAGLLGSLAGMGGGFVMIPLMTSKYVFSPPLTQHQSHGTSLFAVAATGLAGAVSYYTVKSNVSDDDRTKSSDNCTNVVRIPEAAAIAFTAIITARWGAQATLYISGTTLKRALGYLMLCMAPAVPAKAYYLQSMDDTSTNSPSSTPEEEISIWNRLMYPTLIGIGSGFLAGLFGVGGGTIVVPALTLLTDLTHHEALGTSLAAMILPALSGTYTHYQAGNCVLRVAPFLATGALVGAYVGAQLSMQTDESTLRFGFAALLATLGIRTLTRT